MVCCCGADSGMAAVGCCISASKNPLSMNIGLSCSSSILSSAKFMIVIGSLVSLFWLRYSKASLFSWYPAAIVAWIALWSFSCVLIESLRLSP